MCDRTCLREWTALSTLRYIKVIKYPVYTFIRIGKFHIERALILDHWHIGVSGQAVQPVSLASLKLSMAVYGQKLDGRPSR